MIHNSGGMISVLTHSHSLTHAHTHTHTHSYTHTVYTQSLTHILQIVAVPLIQMLEGEIERNKKTVKQLKSKKEKLLATLEELDSTSQIV